MTRLWCYLPFSLYSPYYHFPHTLSRHHNFLPSHSNSSYRLLFPIHFYSSFLSILLIFLLVHIPTYIFYISALPLLTSSTSILLSLPCFHTLRIVQFFSHSLSSSTWLPSSNITKYTYFRFPLHLAIPLHPLSGAQGDRCNPH